MSGSNEDFVFCIGCMDGRERDAIGRMLNHYPDTCCDAGTVGVLADDQHSGRSELIERIKRQMAVSVEKHGATSVYVSGHAECAGNPVDDETHQQHILTATKLVQGIAQELGYKVTIHPYWCHRAPGLEVWTATALTAD